jgi:hypothetical protein
MVLSIEELIFLVEYVFREGNRYTELVQEQFVEKNLQKYLYLIAVQFIDFWGKSWNKLRVRRRKKWEIIETYR